MFGGAVSTLQPPPRYLPPIGNDLLIPYVHPFLQRDRRDLVQKMTRKRRPRYDASFSLKQHTKVGGNQRQQDYTVDPCATETGGYSEALTKVLQSYPEMNASDSLPFVTGSLTSTQQVSVRYPILDFPSTKGINDFDYTQEQILPTPIPGEIHELEFSLDIQQEIINTFCREEKRGQ